MTKVLWAGNDRIKEQFRAPLTLEIQKAVPNAELIYEGFDPAEIDYMIYTPNGPIQEFSAYKSLKLIQSIWAGVDIIMANPNLPDVPIARMADTGMAEGMSDYIVGHVLRHHLDTAKFDRMQSGEWLNDVTPILARNRHVAILGLGNLGQFCAARLIAQGFKVSGWSRSPKQLENVTAYHGADGLTEMLSLADIIVLLLPNTPDTENTINAETLSAMKPGAKIVNAGRGEAIDDDALIEALNSGRVAAATLDVFRTEPLPKEHPYWAHPNVLVTPHVAAETRVSTACAFAAENIRRGEAGEPFQALVDVKRGY